MAHPAVGWSGIRGGAGHGPAIKSYAPAMIANLSGVHVAILLVVLLFLVLEIAALVVTIQDDRLTAAGKVLWVVLLLLFPVIGVLVWALDRLTRRRRLAG